MAGSRRHDGPNNAIFTDGVYAFGMCRGFQQSALLEANGLTTGVSGRARMSGVPC